MSTGAELQRAVELLQDGEVVDGHVIEDVIGLSVIRERAMADGLNFDPTDWGAEEILDKLVELEEEGAINVAEYFQFLEAAEHLVDQQNQEESK